MAKIETLLQLLSHQIEFQKRLENPLPNGIVSFECVKESLSQNLYQMIEQQEFLEANEEERKEELIDVLLFMVNKYIFLGVYEEVQKCGDTIFNRLLWEMPSCQSFCQCDSLARLEQNNYITLIREHCTFKPWKARNSEECASRQWARIYFYKALDLFYQMANIVFADNDEFIHYLNKKLNINTDRQDKGY